LKKIIFLVCLVVIGFVSSPYIKGKIIEQKITQTIKNTNNGLEILNHNIDVGYLNTKLLATVKITDGINFLKDSFDKSFDERKATHFKKSIENLSYAQKDQINLLLEGTEIKTQLDIDNISSEATAQGHISKFSNEIMKPIDEGIQTNNYFARKISDMLKNKKFAFELQKNTLKIKDIKETVSQDGISLGFNLSGFKINPESSFIDNLNLSIKGKKADISLNFVDIMSSYIIKNNDEYTSQLKIWEVSMKNEKMRNAFDLYIENLRLIVDTNLFDDRADYNMRANIDKFNFDKFSISNTLLSLVANVDAKSLKELNSLDPNSRYIKEDFQKIIEKLLENKPKISFSAKTKNIVLKGQEFSSEIEANVNLKLKELNDFNSFVIQVNNNPQNLVNYLDGSQAYLSTEKSTIEKIAPLLNKMHIQTKDSSKEGFEEIVIDVKKNALYINDRKLM